MRRHLLKVWLTRCKAVKPAQELPCGGLPPSTFMLKEAS